jgi:hypothetical protein
MPTLIAGHGLGSWAGPGRCIDNLLPGKSSRDMGDVRRIVLWPSDIVGRRGGCIDFSYENALLAACRRWYHSLTPWRGLVDFTTPEPYTDDEDEDEDNPTASVRWNLTI